MVDPIMLYNIKKTGTSTLIFSKYSHIILITSMSMILFLAFFMKTEYMDNHLGTGRLIKSIILTVFLTYIFIAIAVKKFKFTPDLIFVLSYTLLALFSGTVINHSISAKSIGFPLEFCLAYLGIVSFVYLADHDKKIISTILWIALSLLFVHVVIGYSSANLEQLTSTVSYNSYIDSRITGLFSVSPDLAIVCMSVSILSTGAFLFYRRSCPKAAFALLIPLFISIFALILTTSRAAVIGYTCYFLTTMYLIYTYKKSSQKKINRRNILAASAVILVFLALLLFSGILEAFISKFFISGSSFRLGFWKFFFREQLDNIFSLNFLFGKGFEVKTVNTLNPEYQNMHNFLMTIWARAGFPAMVMIISLLIHTIRKSLKSGKILVPLRCPPCLYL